MPEEQSGSPACGLYIHINIDKANTETLQNLRQMALAINRASGYEKNMTLVEFTFKPDDDEAFGKTEALVQVAQSSGLIAIIRNNYQAAKAMSADGVMLDDRNDIKLARESLGGEAIIGLSCATTKNAAEKAIAYDIDYIEFGTPTAPPPINLLSWWSTKTDKPSLARGNFTNDTCGAHAKAGASFIEITNYLFNHPKGAMQATVNAMYALELAEIKLKLN